MRKTDWLAALVAALAMAAAPFAAAQDALPKPKTTTIGLDRPESILWVGNSFFYYNNSMHGHVRALALAADPKSAPRQISVTISGSGVDWHDMESYFRKDGLGKYSFDANNNVVFNKIDKLFDVVIFMDCSQCPIHPTLAQVFTEFSKKNIETIRRNGAVPAMFASWAYQDKPEMAEQLAAAYLKAGNEHGVLVIPAGLAFARAIRERPQLNLYAPDKRHPSLAGTYLGAAVVYAAVMGKSPVGLKYDADLGAETAGFLQRVADETVKAFYGR
ncbi:MAG: hypothetical protein JNK46_20320 [Methylobacteriaceae bacterium]|nr:hypothetical protein [Methylobacteriaceae bacterium]